MKFVSRAAVLVCLVLVSHLAGAQTLREKTLRDQALRAGLVAAEQLVPEFSKAKSEAGRLLFESTVLSLSRETSCQTCHLDRFASADGLPLGIGTGGRGEGIERATTGGDILPRNTLALWGRGSIGFETFFWDGKVDATSGRIVSQFGDEAPSNDPLVVAVHLPAVEIREMIPDNAAAELVRTETIDSAETIYREIESRVRADPALSAALSEATGLPPPDVRFVHVADALADFIRDRFRIKATRFHKFIFAQGQLSENEIAGGLLFFGRGRCVACHMGPFFSDLSYHAIPFIQYGHGKNGFGVDYGRYNTTLDPYDLYKFRTPPLFNVTQTAPYSHSGSIYDLSQAIRAHVDPLSQLQGFELDYSERSEFYRRLGIWVREPAYGVELDNKDIETLVTFLKTLEFATE